MINAGIRLGMAGWAVVLATATLAQAAYVELPDGTRREGSEVRARSDGTIILTTAQGQFTYQKGHYAKAVADKPADYDRARQLMSQKNYDEALKVLDPIIQNFRFLEWDNNARVLRAQILTAKGDVAGAVDTYDQLFRATPEFRKNTDVLWAYYTVLVGAKQYDKLLPQLDELISKGSRADAAKAQVVRGDIKMSQANIEGAVLDYLRSAILFESEKAVQPEALFKAAEGLEKMRDPRAKDLYRKVASEFGGTPWGQKAAGK
jgi:tetratricopeptide (TPR) repeat protein